MRCAALSLVGLLIAGMAALQPAKAAPLRADALRGPELLQLAGCGLGVRRGPDEDCTPVRPWRGGRHAHLHGFNDGYVDGYEQGVANGALPYAGYVRSYPVYLPELRSCGLNYSYVCGLGVCWPRCW